MIHIAKSYTLMIYDTNLHVSGVMSYILLALWALILTEARDVSTKYQGSIINEHTRRFLWNKKGTKQIMGIKPFLVKKNNNKEIPMKIFNANLPPNTTD